jgi:aspartate/glutamate racemase
MKRTIDPIEQEINEIRLKIYEEIKDMTAEQKKEYYRKETESIIKEHGFKVVKSE